MVRWRKRKPDPDQVPTVVLGDGDTITDANGTRFLVARIPQTPEGVTVGPCPGEPPAEFRWLAARTFGLYAAYRAYFDEEMAKDLFWSRMEWEAMHS